MSDYFETETKIIALALCIVIFPILWIASCTNEPNVVKAEQYDNARRYECDYHTLSFNTCISYEKDGETYYIEGNIVTFLTDPLKLTNSNRETIGYADDSYHIIGQDDHAIIVNDQFEVDLCGNFEFAGNSYYLYNEDGEKVGSASFNMWCTYGYITDENTTIIAEYHKDPVFNDYTVTIYDNDICSDEAILMIVASYVSDYHADND